MERWWALAQDADGRWSLVAVPDSLTESETATYDPTRVLEPPWLASTQWPALATFPEVVDLILAVTRRRRTTTIAGQWDRWAVIAYLDNLPDDERAALIDQLETSEPAGSVTLHELRWYEENLRVKGRQSEAVALLKTTVQRMWPETMTAGRLTQFGKRCGDEVFMVLRYESWTHQAKEAVTRAVADAETTTGDIVRALVTTRPFSLEDLR